MKRSALVHLAAMTAFLLILGCTGREGPTGPAGEPGPAAKWYDFSLVFSPTHPSNYYSLYDYSDYQDNDVVITYWKADSVTFVQLPYTFYGDSSTPVTFFTVIDESYGQPWLWVMTERADSLGGSPWTTTVTCEFRAVVIKAVPGKAAPSIDYRDYQEVKKYYCLPD